MLQILAAIVAGFGVFLLLRSLWIKSGLTARQTLWTAGALAVVLTLIALAATGRLNWIVAAVAALVPFLRRGAALFKVVPLLNTLFPGWRTRFQQRPRAAPGANRSTTETTYLRMTLDHATGHMDGEVRQGLYQGRLLSELTMTQLTALLAQMHDYDSERLLESFLDRNFDGWRDRGEHAGKGSATAGGMSRSDALEVLGLADGASRDEIITAHRRLIQRLHPDRGGSTFLAAQINDAKKLLLGE